MKTTFLDFEQSIAELENKIEALRFVQDDLSLINIGRCRRKETWKSRWSQSH